MVINCGEVGQTITGGVLSVTLMVCVFVAVFPQASVAVQVRVMLYSCGHGPAVVTSTKVRTTPGSQRSVAVGMVKAGANGHSMLLVGGRKEITGGILSMTVTVCETWDVLPQSSVAVQVPTRV